MSRTAGGVVRVDGVRRTPSSTRYLSPAPASAIARATPGALALPQGEQPGVVGGPGLVVRGERPDEVGIHRAQNANAAPSPRPNVSAAMLVSCSERISSLGVRPVHAMIAAGSASTSVNSTSSAFG